MKKTILFTLLIALLAILCSCNMDAQDGIYSAIASSTKESSTKVNAYLGAFDNYYYFLTDKCITRLSYADTHTDTSFTEISATGNYAKEAALLEDGSLLVHRHDGTIYKYDKNGQTESKFEDYKTIKLLSNGFFMATLSNVTGLYKPNGNLFVEVKNYQTVLECGNLILVEDTSNKISIYNSSSSSSTPITSVTSDNSYVTVGFQSINNSYYILKADGSVYKITESNTIEKLTTLSYTLASGKTSSFTYKDSTGTDYVVFKTSENFISISTKDYTLSTVTTGYGSIRQNLVVNIAPVEGTSQEKIVATWSNGVYKIDPTDTSKDPVQIL